MEEQLKKSMLFIFSALNEMGIQNTEGFIEYWKKETPVAGTTERG